MSGDGYRCHGCQGVRGRRMYLCNACWAKLPKATRLALVKRDGRALERYAALLEALDERKTPLDQVVIA